MNAEGTDMPDWDEELDLIAVGSGIGGCAAAIAAAEAGLTVALLEKSPRLGGATSWSQGILWVGNNHFAEAQGAEDSPEEVRAYLDYLGAERNDPEVTSSYADNAPLALRFFERAGIPFYLADGVPDHAYPLAPGSKRWGRTLYTRLFEARSVGEWHPRMEFTPYGHGRATFEEMAAWGGRAGYRNWDRAVLAEREAQDVRAGGAAVAGHFIKAALDHHVEIRPEAEVTRLLVDDGRVEGLEVRSADGTRRLRARCGVVLATGAHGSNSRLARWVDEFVGWPPANSVRDQGDGFILAAEHGAAFAVMHGSLAAMICYHAQAETVDGQPLSRVAGPREVASPHNVLVNRFGQRFADEATFANVATKLRHFEYETHQLINVPYFMIFDSQYLAKYGLPPLPPDCEPPDWLPRADTLADLAGILGIESQGLEATIDRFNRFVAQGRDDDFNRGGMLWSNTVTGDRSLANPNLGTIQEPPFFGMKMVTNMNSVGLVIDPQGQVRHLRGHSIPGLYACGELVASSLFSGVGVQAGQSLAPGMTFGWLAAQHAAQRSLPS